MLVGINASFLRKPDSGIGQVTSNFMRKLEEITSSKSQIPNIGNLEFILYLEEETNLEFSNHFKKKVILPGCYKRDDLVRKVLWEKYLLPKEVEKDGCEVLVSLYQSSTRLNSKNKLDSRLRGNDNQKLRHIMFVHDAVWKIFPQYINNWRKKIYYNLVDKAIPEADKILTISENSKKDIIKYFQIPENKISVNYIDCDEVFKNKIKNPLNPPFPKGEIGGFGNEATTNYQLPTTNYLFYVGGFDVRKNVDRLIESYGILWDNFKNRKKIENETPLSPSLKLRRTSNPPFPKGETGGFGNDFPDLVLAGSFHKNLVPLVTDVPGKIKEISKKYDLPEDKIRMIGFVKQEELPKLYKNAKLFCYPSLYEGFGLPPLEAQNCGCPVVTANNSSLPEVIDKNSALLVDPENTEEIAAAMEKIINDNNLRESLVQRGYENAKRFSWKKFTKEVLEEIFEN